MRFFNYNKTLSFWRKHNLLKNLFLYSTLPVGFIWILIFIWYNSLFKITQLQSVKWHWLVGPPCKYICKSRFLTDLGKARWSSTNTFIIHSITHNVRHPLPPLALRRPQAQTVEDGTLSHIADYVAQAYCILKLVLMNWWILHIGGVLSRTVCDCNPHSRLF